MRLRIDVRSAVCAFNDHWHPHAIDDSSGVLKEIGKYPSGKDANWVEIVSFD